MEGFTTTVQLPDDLNRAITKAINDAFATAKRQAVKGSEYPMYMNMKQATNYLGVSYTTLKKWIKMYPDFPVKTIDGSYHINREKLDEFMTNK
ncbi:MerR family transcriptional regulator [Limosilactobacillus galli]|uniref:helix-turn-helix domain-containing protein n=1 Tax=Limosilactobacillus galli TaxID=2991834 RepID=UPI0024BA7720|nr:helix-turn-helix domain-containing protein [Limosilactobacillus galli]